MGPKIKRSQEGPDRERTEAPFSHLPPIPSQEVLIQKRGGEEVSGGGREVSGGGKMAGGCGKVTFFIHNPTVSPDGCGGWGIYIRSGGASQEEALTYHGRQSPLEGVPPGW